jgi:hypothetical protein
MAASLVPACGRVNKMKLETGQPGPLRNPVSKSNRPLRHTGQAERNQLYGSSVKAAASPAWSEGHNPDGVKFASVLPIKSTATGSIPFLPVRENTKSMR